MSGTEVGFRLAPQQVRAWQLTDNGGLAQSVALIDGPADGAALKSACAAVMARYEILRTTFRRLPAVALPVQVIAAAAAPAFEETDSDWETVLRRHRSEPFDLAAGPLLRVTLAAAGPDRRALVVSTPAMCADAASLGLFLREVAARCTGEDAGTDEPLQYADLADWLNDMLESPDTDGGRAYWRDMARRCGPGVPLDGGPADGVTPPSTVSATLDARATAALDAAAADCGVDAAAVLLACWRLVAGQPAGDGPLAIAVTCPGREHDDLIDAWGPLSMSVPVPFPPIGPAVTIRELVATAASHWAEAAGWQPYLDWAEFGGSLDRPVYYPVAFDHAEAVVAPLGAGSALRVVAQSVTADRARLRLSSLRRGSDVLLTLHHDHEAVDPSTAGRLLDRFVGLVWRLSDLLDARAGEIDLVPAVERERIRQLSRTAPAEGEIACLHELFEAQARRTPDRVALVGGGGEMTYAELDRRSGQLANALRRHGVGPEVRVGLCLPAGIDAVVAILAVWKAGGAYLPLPTAGPRERVRYMLRDAGVRLVVTDSALAQDLPLDDVEAYPLDGPRASWLAEPAQTPDSGVRPANLAYVIYTSGSTGGPKGVLIEHAAVALFRHAMRIAVHGSDAPGRQVSLNAALTFDASIQQLVTLLDGDTLHVFSDTLRRDDRLTVDYVRQVRLDVLNGTPTQLEALVAAGLCDGDHHVPGKLMIAGEALSPALWRALSEAPTTAFNIYGPTECTINATATAVRAAGPDPLIGRPLPGYQVLLLDDRMRPVPIGVPGEIFIGGPALARGYLGATDRTAERFVPHPDPGTPGERLYATGDLARLRPDGQLEFLGRRDDQVKVRGYRIEPGEIEEALRRHEGVRDAVVVARDDPGGRRLVAYCVPPTGGSAPNGAELRAFLDDRLPDYMVPAVFVTLDAFPRTSSGKLDHRALPDPDAARPETGTAYAPPSTPAEIALAKVWSTFLGVERVGIDDDYFAAGGDSIRAIRIRAAAAEQGLNLSVQQIFEHRTVRELAAVAAPAAATTVAAPTLPGAAFALLADVAGADGEDLRGRGVEDAYPLTGTQAGMVFQSELRPGEGLFHNVRTVHLRAPLDPDALRVSLAELVAAHPALRTSVDMSGFDVPVQLVHQEAAVPLLVEDLGDRPAAEQEAAIAEFCARERETPFDLSRPPLLRVAVHRRSSATFQATVTLHEVVLDGWSVAVLLTELLNRYRARLGEAVPIPPPPAALPREAVAAERRVRADPTQRAFWADYLRGAPHGRMVPWPAAERDGEDRPHEVVTVAVSDPTAAKLRALATTISVPLKSVLLAAHLYVVSRFADSTDVLTGLVANIRPEVPDGDRVIGQFLNTLPLAATVAGGSWADLARRAAAEEQRLLPYRCYPAGYLDRRGTVETAFNFTHFHVYGDVDGVQRLGDDFIERTDLSLLADFTVASGTAEIGLTLNTNGLCEPQVAALARAYADTLVAIATAPDDPIGLHRPIVGDARPESSETPPEASSDYASLFEEQARRRPHATAVRCGDDELTYEQLDRRADRLADVLVGHGAGPETLVAVAAGRGVDLLVGLLAVVKAGAVYLPVDPRDPQARVDRLLRAAGVRLALVAPAHAATIGAMADRVSVVPIVTTDSDLPAARRPARGGSAHLAYAVYTSGSTGEPRATMVHRAAMLNHLRAKVVTLGLGPEDRVAQTASVTFDVSIWQLLAPLLAGAQVQILTDAEVRNPVELLPALARYGVTVAAAVPAVLRASLAATVPLPALRVMVSTGEVLPAQVARAWLLAYPGTRLINAYGPAECADNVAQYALAGTSGEGACPIGDPLPGARLYILDHTLTPVPDGMPGQLGITGACVGRGYLGDPARTAERFVPDPSGSGGRLYLTGDQAYRDAGGAVRIIGRRDRQMKINGVRVEPAEIEAALVRHATVADALVAAVPGRTRTLLAAYVVPCGADLDAAALRAFLADQLPTALVPARFYRVAVLPPGRHGKADRRVTPSAGEAELMGSAIRDEPEEPATATEEALCALLAGLLGVTPTRRDDFFELGGDSITAAQLVGRISQSFGVDLQLRRLYAEPTVAQIAGMVDAAAAAK